jgi:hypothetical protein
MATMITPKYNIFDFYAIRNGDSEFELDDFTIKIINTLSKRVGAPTYQKTPVFKKRDKRHPQEITNDDWEEMRNFKKTELKRNEEGIEVEIDKIRNHLNQITEDNYELMRDYISDILLKIIRTNVERSELLKVGKSIFEIGSMNKFWSKLYAKLYKDLIDKMPIMHEISTENFNDFSDLFENIRFISSEENYDLFCDINKENEKRRSMSCFFVHLMNNEVINIEDMMKLITRLRTKFIIYINEDDKKNEVIEIAENLTIIIREGQNKLEDDEEFWEKTTNFVEKYSECDYKIYPSFPSKCSFTFMDLYEEL